MSRPSRMMVLVAIVAAGLLVIKSMALTTDLAAVFDPAQPAWASSGDSKSKSEGHKKKKSAKHKNAKSAKNSQPANSAEDTSGAAATETSMVSAAPPPACAAPGAAEQAGLSEEELNVYMTLAKRAKVLDKRETAIATREGLLDVSQQKVDARIARLEALKKDIQTMLGQLDGKEKTQILALTKLYNSMKPKSAAKIFTGLDQNVLLQVTSRMKADTLSKVMAAMPPQKAGALTIALARRHQLPDSTSALPGVTQPAN